MNGFRGVFPALVTPMTASEEIDYPKLEALVEYLIGAGVHGLIPLGSTGEFYALTPQERREVLTAVMHAAAGRVPVVPGVNAGIPAKWCSTAARRKPSAPRAFWSPRPTIRCRGPTKSWNTSAQWIGPSAFPIMLYNYPGRTGVDMRPELLERLAELKNVRYVKESTGETAADQRDHPPLRRPLGGLLRLRYRRAGEFRPRRGRLGGGHRQCLRRRTRAALSIARSARTTLPRVTASSVCSRCWPCWKAAASSRKWSRPAAGCRDATPVRPVVPCCRRRMKKRNPSASCLRQSNRTGKTQNVFY